MSATAQPAEIAAAQVESRALLAGLWIFAAYNIALALFLAIAPHAFYRSLGPFGAYNRHYEGDTATFVAAFALGFLVAVRRPGWRVPILALSTVQFALHSVNHLVDIAHAHPAWTGYFDFFVLLASTLLLAWLLNIAVAEARGASPRPQGANR
ncbi:MAG TPA: hypothetical protein VFW29_04285 [Solirubrobacteraceae bacterium]|nr:hypothetical protein [Solirubrobacteraceae bacterium]